MSSIKFLKWRVALRAFTLVLLVLLLCLLQTAREVRVIAPVAADSDECRSFNLTGISNSAPNFALPLFGGASPAAASCGEREKFTKSVFQALMDSNFLQSDARVLCVGERSASAVLALRHLGFFNAVGTELRRPFLSLLKQRFVYELSFDDRHFDFVFLEDLDKVSFPARLTLEVERVLRPGGTGSFLTGARGAHSGTPAAMLSNKSVVVRVCDVGCSTTMVVFKKRLDNLASSLDRIQLPTTCPSIDNNKPFMKYIEPLNTSRIEPEISYLPYSMNISSRNKLIYINLGAGEYAKTSIAKMSDAYCSGHHVAFEVYIIDHKTSVLSSLVMDSGINFVYHPALAGDNAAPDISSDEFLAAPADEEGFDFVRWFKETVSDGDFVLLMMKAELVELNILVELFESGAICHVDEVFLRCSGAAADCAASVCGNCMDLLESLRKSGVFVHQWLGD